MKRTETLYPLLLALIYSFISLTTSAQSISVNVLENRCLDDASAEVILSDVPEPVTVLWHNAGTGEEVNTSQALITLPSSVGNGVYIMRVSQENNYSSVKEFVLKR